MKEISLEEYDTLTPLPMVVARIAGVPNVLTFRFPKGAARGGEVNLAADQKGPGDMSGSMDRPVTRVRPTALTPSLASPF